MAIQQVGGRGVYVITGSGRDPRKASNGQSWADLVTQQKYMLIKEAQKEAIRRIDLETKDYAARQQAYQQLQKDIRDQIDKAQSDIAGIKLKETEAQTRLESARQKELMQRARGRKITTTTGSFGGGGGGRASKEMSGAQYRAELTDQYQQNQAIADQKMAVAEARANDKKIRDLILRKKPEFFTQQENALYQQLDEATKSQVDNAMAAQARADAYTKRLNDYDDNANNPEEQRRQIQEYQQLPPQAVSSDSGGGGTKTTSTKYKDQQPVPETPTVDYSELISPLEERIKSLEGQLLGLERPEAPSTETTPLMRQIAREDYGLGVERQPREPRQPRERMPLRERFAPSRRAEMDALGIPEQALVDKQVPVETDEFQFQPSLIENVTGQEQPTTEPLSMIDRDNIFMNAMQRLPSRTGELPVGGGTSRFELPVEEEQSIEPYIRPQEQEIEPTQLEGMPTLRPKPTQTPIGDALRESYPVDEIESLIDGLNQYFDNKEKPKSAPAPLPTRPIGDVKGIFDRLVQERQPKAQPSMKDMFTSVEYGTDQQKKQLALQAIMQKAQELGPTNPAYIKIKQKILDQLNKVLDPKKHRQMKMVEKNQSDNRGDYFALSKSVRGLQERNAQLVYSLFPVNEETKATDADQLYKNAQKQIQTNIADSYQRKKAQEFLDLMYLAYMNEK